jgi:hypothetical protein
VSGHHWLCCCAICETTSFSVDVATSMSYTAACTSDNRYFAGTFNINNPTSTTQLVGRFNTPTPLGACGYKYLWSTETALGLYPPVATTYTGVTGCGGVGLWGADRRAIIRYRKHDGSIADEFVAVLDVYHQWTNFVSPPLIPRANVFVGFRFGLTRARDECPDGTYNQTGVLSYTDCGGVLRLLGAWFGHAGTGLFPMSITINSGPTGDTIVS